MDVVNLDTSYGAPAIEWPRVERRLAGGMTQAPPHGHGGRTTEPFGATRWRF